MIYIINLQYPCQIAIFRKCQFPHLDRGVSTASILVNFHHCKKYGKNSKICLQKQYLQHQKWSWSLALVQVLIPVAPPLLGYWGHITSIWITWDWWWRVAWTWPWQGQGGSTGHQGIFLPCLLPTIHQLSNPFLISYTLDLTTSFHFPLGLTEDWIGQLHLPNCRSLAHGCWTAAGGGFIGFPSLQPYRSFDTKVAPITNPNIM